MRFTTLMTITIFGLALGLSLDHCAASAQVGAASRPGEETPAPPDVPAASSALPAATVAPVPAADGSGLLHFEAMWIVCGARQFYLAFGRWPQSWREVCDSGLFQARLVLADGHEVDPDSQAPLKEGETRYIPPAKEDEAAQIATLLDPKVGEHQQALETPLSYKDMFNAMYLLQEDSAVAKQMQDYFNGVLADPKRVLQFAVGGMLEQGLGLYKSIHGDYPPDWAAFLASGLSPAGTDAVNPATGKPLRCDGGPGDFSYKYYPPAAGEATGKYYFSHIDFDGTAPKFPVLY